MPLRKHQAAVSKAIDGIIAGSPVRTIIVNATPGSGKSMLPIIMGRLITAGLVDKLAWICPRSSLQDQGERNFTDRHFRQMLGHKLTIRSSTNDTDPSRGTDGFITTFQAVGVDKYSTVLREFHRYRYALVIDEGHHAADGGEGQEEAWMRCMIPLYEAAAFRLIMSGTMSRNDKKRIAFIPYRKTGEDEFTPDFAREHIPLDGAKLKIDDVLNKEVLVTAIRLKPSKFSKAPACLTIQMEIDGERYVCFTGSSVLAEQAKTYETEIPFLATIKKIDKYYTFT